MFWFDHPDPASLQRLPARFVLEGIGDEHPFASGSISLMAAFNDEVENLFKLMK